MRNPWWCWVTSCAAAAIRWFSGCPRTWSRSGREAGLTTYPVGPDSQQFLESPDGQRWLAAGDVMALTQALGKIVHDNAALLDADTLRVCDGADLIVTGSLSEHRAACVAEAAGNPAGLPALRADAARPVPTRTC